AMSQTRSAPSPPLARSSSAPGLTLGADGLGLVAPSPLRKEDTFLGMYRDRDRRHADWNVNASYAMNLDGTLARPQNMRTLGPGHPFAALWDSPTSSWTATAKKCTLNPMRSRAMTTPGI
ncbi:unnamed protein product, partial [Polarella glacialis]